MAKLHWTQTPEGRARMSESQKKRYAAMKDKSEHFRQLAKLGTKSKRGPYKTKKKATLVITSGWWKVTLEDDGTLRIERA